MKVKSKLCTSSLYSRRSLLRLFSAGALTLTASTVVKAKSLSLRIDYYDDFAPYSLTGEGGAVIGIFIDALNEVLGNRCHIELTHSAMPWARAQQEVKEGRADAFCTLVTDVRKEYVEFSRETLLKPDHRVVVFARNNPKAANIRKIASRDDLKNFLIGTYLGDSRVDTLFKGMNIDIVADMKRMLLKVAASRTDLAVLPGPVWKYHARALGIRDQLEEVWFSLQPGFYLGVRKSYEAHAEVLTLFDKAVVAARNDGSLDRIAAAYA